MAKSGGYDSKEEGPIEVIGLASIMVLILMLMVWIGGSTSIVKTFTPLFLWIGKIWQYVPLPGELGTVVAAKIYGDAAKFIVDPSKVSLGQWVSFVNWSIGPVVVMSALLTLVVVIQSLAKKQPQVFRRFKDADELMERLSWIFTGTAPILHLRKALSQHKDPYWGRQRFPEEVLLNDSVSGKRLVTGSRRDVASLRFHEGRVRDWLEGFVEPTTEDANGSVQRLRRPSGAPQVGKHADGRWVSHTLGVLAVRLADSADRAQFKRMPAESGFSFSDRFTPVGKVMFALLCAQAFGGKEGTEDWFKARDQLNNSCRGAPHGFANLTVADWLYKKYRCNELAHKLFAVHQWEYTYLLEMFAQAKRNGKIPDSEFRWLKPMDRSLWYVLNTAGRFTPHTESGAAFTMHAFERGWARRKRWPLRLNENNQLEPSVVVKCATEALQLEFERYVNGEDETGNEWWKDNHAWVSSNPAVQDALKPVPAPRMDVEAAKSMESTPFDSIMSDAGVAQMRNFAQTLGKSSGDSKVKRESDGSLDFEDLIS